MTLLGGGGVAWVDSYCTLIPQSYETQLDSMGRIRHELKLQILQMHKDGISVAGIRRRLVEMGHRVSRDTISYWIHKYRVGLFGQSLDITVPVVNTNVSERDTEIIKECLAQDSTLSSRDIHKILRDDGATFGLSTTKWAIDASGFTHSKPRYGQMVREPNKVKRVEFCERLIATNEDFSDVIFSDECSVQLNQNKACSYRLKEAHSTVLPKPKHPLKIHVWAAISKRGASAIRLFEGIMDSEFYTESILGDTLLPFINIKFPDGHRFQQDNDPKHTSKRAKSFMTDHGINWWNNWPAGKLCLIVEIVVYYLYLSIINTCLCSLV